MATISIHRPIRSHPWQAIILLPLMAGLLVAFFYFQPVTYADWIFHFRRAALNWRDPFMFIYNPPWLFPFLYPLAILPPRWGAALLMASSVAIVLVHVRSPRKSFFVLTSAPMIAVFTLGQIDALPMLGLLVPPALSLPILAIKPQGIALAALRRLSARSLAVALAVLALSVALWGIWPLRFNRPGHLLGVGHNASLFPCSVPLGLLLVWLGLRLRSDALLCWASLCLLPYWMPTSMLPAVATSVKESVRWYVWLAVWLASWAYLIAMRPA